jgi:FAD binding domain
MTRAISRRAFIVGAFGALGSGAVLGACRATTPVGPQAKSSTVSAPSTVLAPEDWSSLDDSIAGRVILPSNGDYAATKNVFNTRFDNSTPAAIVTVMSTGDVQKAMAFAARKGIKIAARSGGHSYIGDSAASGAMVIDLRQLSGGITYDDGSGSRPFRLRQT